MTELKRCPFCGGEANIHEFGDFTSIHSFIVSCKECGCKQASSISKESVVESWNTRKPIQNIVERLEKLKKYESCGDCPKDGMCDKKPYECTSCYSSTAIEIVKEEGGLHGRKQS